MFRITWIFFWMSVCGSALICVCVVFGNTWIFVWVSVCGSARIHVCMSVCGNAVICVCMPVCGNALIFLCMSVCGNALIHVCIPVWEHSNQCLRVCLWECSNMCLHVGLWEYSNLHLLVCLWEGVWMPACGEHCNLFLLVYKFGMLKSVSTCLSVWNDWRLVSSQELLSWGRGGRIMWCPWAGIESFPAQGHHLV